MGEDYLYGEWRDLARPEVRSCEVMGSDCAEVKPRLASHLCNQPLTDTSITIECSHNARCRDSSTARPGGGKRICRASASRNGSVGARSAGLARHLGLYHHLSLSASEGR